MRALTATVQIVLDPEVIGPDAPTEWSGALADASACDYLSSLLSESESGTIIDWRYDRDVQPDPLDPTWAVIEIDRNDYGEGDAFTRPEWTADDDRELAAAEAAFEEAGDRDDELADRIDSLRARRDAAGKTPA